MSYSATVFNVLIASPGDVEAERLIVREVIHEWNAIHSRKRNLVFQPIGWDTHSHPSMSDRAQGVINEQLVKDADLLVAVFWTRIGTPTGEAPGGSVEELEKHRAAGKPVMVYFSNAPVRLDSVDDTQYAALKAYRKKCEGSSLIAIYDSLTDFRQKFSRHLATRINEDEYFGGEQTPPQINTTRPVIMRQGELLTIPEWEVPPLSNEAKTLLLAAADDRDGMILHARFIGGEVIQAGGKQFIEEGNPRSRAAWGGALQELEQFDLIQPLSAEREVYHVTREGYRMAELLRG